MIRMRKPLTRMNKKITLRSTSLPFRARRNSQIRPAAMSTKPMVPIMNLILSTIFTQICALNAQN